MSALAATPDARPGLTRVLVVDDSATMRSLLRRVLEQDPRIEVVGAAADPLEARAAIKALNPDVVTLDVEMPNMNGIEFLGRLMRLRPTPVVMVSSLTTVGADATLQALELGAVDCVAKPSTGGVHSFDELPAKVRAAHGARLRPPTVAPAPAAPPAVAEGDPDGRAVAIGSSTGGVEALIAVVTRFPARCAPTVIVQHMPAGFTTSLAARLDRLSAPVVREAVDGARLLPGHVHLAPGGLTHVEVVGPAGAPRLSLRPTDPVNGHRPSVDVLFASVARTLGPRALGVILTGMGRDGAQGLLAMREAGADTLGQDESSAVIYGMPKAAFEIGAVRRQLPLEKIGAEITSLTQRQGAKAR